MQKKMNSLGEEKDGKAEVIKRRAVASDGAQMLQLDKATVIKAIHKGLTDERASTAALTDLLTAEAKSSMENPAKILSERNLKQDAKIESDFIIGALKANVFTNEELSKMLQLIQERKGNDKLHRVTI